MNMHLLKSDLENLSTAHKKMFLNYLLFLHWTERPFKGVCELAAPFNTDYLRKPILFFRLHIFGCILLGAWAYICFHGITVGWLRIAGLWRIDSSLNDGQECEAQLTDNNNPRASS